MKIQTMKHFSYFYRVALYVYGLLSIISMQSVYGETQHNAILEPETVWMTVFVHGIISVKPYLTLNNCKLFFQDQVKDTYYEKSIAFTRQNEFFYKNQAMGPIGLHYIDPDIDVSHNKANRNISSSIMAYLFEQMNHRAGTGQYNNRYYIFGWTGLLSATARYEDGKKLFEALDHEVQRLRKQNLNPKVRVIGYSHGGNVALNIGEAHRKDYPHSSLEIDELVVLGTPIQHDTDYLINDPVFKRVYNIYSLSDRVQRIDFFSLNRFFSGRVFIGRKGFTLPDKLVQVQLKITKLRDHKGSIQERVDKTSNLKEWGILTGNFSLLENASPGHAELWAFGWTPQHYRSNYPLYPLPTVSLLPFITFNLQDYQHVKNSKGKPKRHDHLIVDIRPEHEYILLRKKNKKTVDKIIPFVPRDQLAEIKKTVLSLAPENFTRKEYELQTQKAIEDSFTQYKQLYAPKGMRKYAQRCHKKKRRNRRYKKQHALEERGIVPE